MVQSVVRFRIRCRGHEGTGQSFSFQIPHETMLSGSCYLLLIRCTHGNLLRHRRCSLSTIGTSRGGPSQRCTLHRPSILPLNRIDAVDSLGLKRPEHGNPLSRGLPFLTSFYFGFWSLITLTLSLVQWTFVLVSLFVLHLSMEKVLPVGARDHKQRHLWENHLGLH